MSKKIDESKKYIAIGITGWIENGNLNVFDENNSRLDPTNLDDKIKIYEREVKGWFLEPARKLCTPNISHDNSFIVIMICLAYIEGVEQYRCGSGSNGKSARFFKSSMKRIFSIADKVSEAIYTNARCGLFHNGMVKSNILYDLNQNEAILVHGKNINIQPELFLKKIEEDFEQYLRDLRNQNNKNLRDNFNKLFCVI